MMIPEAVQALVLAAETYGLFNLCVAYWMGRRSRSSASARVRTLPSWLSWSFPKPDVKGRTEVLLTPLELLDAPGKFAPPPRGHRH